MWLPLLALLPVTSASSCGFEISHAGSSNEYLDSSSILVFISILLGIHQPTRWSKGFAFCFSLFNWTSQRQDYVSIIIFFWMLRFMLHFSYEWFLSIIDHERHPWHTQAPYVPSEEQYGTVAFGYSMKQYRLKHKLLVILNQKWGA